MFTKVSLRIFIFIVVISIVLSGCSPKATMATGADVTWHLVVLGDSSFWELGDAYAEQIRQDVGVQVEVHDYAIGFLSAGSVLDAIQTGKSPSVSLSNLPDDLAKADVVVMILNPNDSPNPDHPLEFDGCFLSMPPISCDPEGFDSWINDLKSIWAEIFRLREGKPTILRATDLYNPLVAPWQEAGVFEACTQCWENFSDAARQAADAYNIPFLSRLDAVNGPNHDLDPRTMGYIVEDGQHPTPLLAQFTARKLAELGYEPVTPP